MWITIDRNNETTLTRQIYTQVRDKILSQELEPDERIPSTRELSSLLHVSRNVILEAYDLLELEGYIVTRPQSGTYVAKGASISITSKHQNSHPANTAVLSSKVSPTSIDLRSGIPALELLPLKKWAKYQNEVLLDHTAHGEISSIFGYGDANGTYELRMEIQQYLLRMRGLMCTPEQIVITTGSLHSFSLLSHLLLTKESDSYIIEDPLHIEIKRTLATASTNYCYVPVDSQGMQTHLLPVSSNPSFVFVTPSHQYPTGGILPIQRRIELIEYARKKNCYIIEDDYDSEYRYDGTPVSTLYSLDSEHVIYVGTFSKVLFPSIRVGYMILPEPLIDRTLYFIRYHDYFTDTINQLTLSRMLQERVIDKHVSNMKKLYKKRHDYMLTILSDLFGNSISIHGIHAGLHFMVTFYEKKFTDEVIEVYKKDGVQIYPVWQHSENINYKKNSLVVGYSHLNETQMQKAIQCLHRNL